MKVAIAVAIISVCQSYVLNRDQYEECLSTRPSNPPYVPFYNSWSNTKCNLNQFHLISKVGKGKLAKVYKAFHVETGKIVALKKIDVFRPSTIKFVRNEECILGSVTKSDNLPSAMPDFYCAFTSGPSVYLAMEFIEGAVLNSSIAKDWINQSNLITQIGYLLDFLHKQGIAHMDVKPENIMITQNGLYNLIDYGFACNIVGNELIGLTVLFTAPEILRAARAKLLGIGSHDLAQSDWYAFGLTIYSLKQPLSPIKASIEQLSDSGVLPFINLSSDDLLVRNLLEPKAEFRWKYNDILENLESKSLS